MSKSMSKRRDQKEKSDVIHTINNVNHRQGEGENNWKVRQNIVHDNEERWKAISLQLGRWQRPKSFSQEPKKAQHIISD